MASTGGSGVTAARGFKAGSVYAGIKSGGRDLALLYSEQPCVCAATFTTNAVKAAAVQVSQPRAAGGRVRAVVANSGNANACTGQQGTRNAERMIELAAEQLGLQPDEVAVCSTGIIGLQLPMEKIEAAFPQLEPAAFGGHDFALGIMTTDSRPKEAQGSVDLGGVTVSFGGACKGVGMIHPNMATMLAFMTTDAAVDGAYLKEMWQRVVDKSWNMICVDGDSSTNDTAIILANGAAGNEPITANSPHAKVFEAALTQVAIELAKQNARDGEGATKLMEVRVTGAASYQDARLIAREITRSPLVKSALHGRDPNWGRIMCAAGYSGGRLDVAKVVLKIGGVTLFENDAPIDGARERAQLEMKGDTVVFEIECGLGDGAATAWGCDLTEQYVRENSEYTT